MSRLLAALRRESLPEIAQTLLVHKLWRPWQRRRWVARCRAAEAAQPLDLSERSWQWAAPAGIPPDWYSPHFYLSAADQEEAARATASPAADQALHQRCEEIARGDFRWLLANTPDLGPVPDWHALLDRPGAWPDRPSHELDYMSEARPGDIRRCWELSRHQYFLVLGRGWRRERDPRWAECFARHLEDWIRRNPPGRGPHWLQAQEVALRAISWCWAWHLFHDAPAFTPELRQLMLRALSWHFRYLEREVCAFGKWTHNHLISELCGLHLLGEFFPQLRGAARLAAWSRRLLLREAEKQIWPDGLAGELSTAYMGFVLDNLVSVLACRRERWRGTVLEQRVAAMGDAAAWLTRPDGCLPLVGDSDSGRGWLLQEELTDRRGYGQLPALVAGQPQAAWLPRRPAPEWHWLLGPRLAEAAAAWSPPAGGRTFHEGGSWCWRQHAGSDAHWLLLRGGAVRPRRWIPQGHQHADALALELSWQGRPLFVDPGTYAYGLETARRQLFRSSRVHSTLWVEGAGSCEFRGQRFGAWNVAASRWDELAASGTEPGAGLSVSYGGVTHRRRVRVQDPGLWIEDWVTRPAGRPAGLAFQLAPGLEAQPTERGWWLPGPGLRLDVELADGARPELRIEPGLVSRRYAEVEEAPRLRILLPAQASCRVTLRLGPADKAED
ncbi:MAG: alginate lyase family protein [Candidatus Delongbacteria bacterium]